jgi:hypothetical protein
VLESSERERRNRTAVKIKLINRHRGALQMLFTSITQFSFEITDPCLRRNWKSSRSCCLYNFDYVGPGFCLFILISVWDLDLRTYSLHGCSVFKSRNYCGLSYCSHSYLFSLSLSTSACCLRLSRLLSAQLACTCHVESSNARTSYGQ